MTVFRRVSGFVALILASALFARPAFAVQHVSLADMTWTEVAACLREGVTTIIIPIGGTEQSGPFIAVGKHNIRAAALARRIAKARGHTLVAPVIAYVPEGGISPRTSHMRFPGTISIKPEVFEGLLTGAAESLKAQGFHRIAFISDHGGYRSEVAHVVRRLNARWGRTDHAIDVTPYYDVIKTRFVPYLKSKGYGADIGQHADIMDTSLMLAVDPEMVRTQRLKTASKPGVADGVYGGDPRRASAALGEIGASMQVDAAVKDLHRYDY